ncbi:hypothetical protein BT93_C1583 [Corymbia citriodora subsp. variegata]|nr:hypothetical protein BT93_C1583 [Corymbia citriodora subsp. variegata]
MVDRKAIILPVFFDVKPRDVKLKTKLYQDALQKHKEKHACEVVQRWKEALEKLNKRDKNLPNHLVGIQDRVKDVMRLLDEGSPDVRYLVIHGMGGIGKTTLARVIFNQIYSRFHGCSFLSSVQEATKDGKIVRLQKQLLSELLNFKPVDIFDSDAGINQIKWKFRQKKVLVVLDDLDEWDQLSKLAAMGDWFGLGSRIIITTRDTNNLAIEEYNVYQMTELKHHHALQLFSKHAFRMDSPPHDYDDISCNITSMAGGLPLALEVIGCSLYRKRKPIWKEMLKKLESVPNQCINGKLKISVEMLKEEQREIFLDIACYYIGEERIFPYYMWKALDFYPNIEIDFLIGASLIKINDDDRLLMHDLLRDIGREIVRQGDLKVYGKHSRLWKSKIALEEVLKTRMGTENIIALKLCGLSKEHNFTSEAFSRLPTLRLLELEGGNLVGDFKNLFLNLQVVNLCLENLVVLKLLDSKFPENWNGWGPCLANRDLKVIHLIRCYLSTTPNFSTCLKLRILAFAEHCPKSPQISNSIGKLERLKRLEIIAARIQQSKLSRSPHFDLCVMPSAMCHLKNLSSLKLEGLCMQELHPSIGEMASLTCLSLDNCYQLRKLPDSIGKLRSLLKLNLSFTRIKKLPDSIGDLKALEKMNLGWTKIMGLPNSIGGLESLLDLNLEFSKITALPASIGYLKRLKHLYMFHSKIRELPNSIGDLKNLEKLQLGYTKLTELPNSIGGLESLLTLDLSNLNITVLPASIGYLKRLKMLSMGYSKIKELPNSIGDLKSLEIMGLGWTQIRVLPNSIGGLESLLSLNLENTNITKIPASLRYLKMLKHLIVSRVKIRELRKAIGMLENLETLAYHDSSNMDMTLPPQLSRLCLSCDDLGSLPRFPLSLHDLALTNLKSPIVQPLPSELRYLSNLCLYRCDSREIVIEQLESLCKLRVQFCKSLVTLALSSLGRLKELDINWCPQLIEIQDLGEMESLKYLHIETCSLIEKLPKLSKLHKLGDLIVQDCRSLQCLPDLANSLLSIWNRRSTETSPERSEHSLLRILNLSHCELLQGGIPNLWRRKIHACPLLGESGYVPDFCRWCSQIKR